MTEWLSDQGMACSVYAAQYLLEALFENGADDIAIELITANNDRSWRHMVESGATITWEAWDMQYKPNQDWNHAWGAAPANLLPRYVLGAQHLTPGWSLARIRPNVSGLDYAKGKIPTPLGAIEVHWQQRESFRIELKLPPKMEAKLELPGAKDATIILINGTPASALFKNGYWYFNQPVSGKVSVEIR